MDSGGGRRSSHTWRGEQCLHAAAAAHESPRLQGGPADVHTDPVSTSLFHLPDVGMKRAAQIS